MLCDYSVMDDPRTVLEARLRTVSQRDLADELGVTEGYISHVLQGRRKFGPKLLLALGIERVVTYRRKKNGKP